MRVEEVLHPSLKNYLNFYLLERQNKLSPALSLTKERG